MLRARPAVPLRSSETGRGNEGGGTDPTGSNGAFRAVPSVADQLKQMWHCRMRCDAASWHQAPVPSLLPTCIVRYAGVQDLPEEVVQLSFTNLVNVRPLADVRLVCKAWERLATPLVTCIKKQQLTVDRLAHCLDKFCNLRSLVVDVPVAPYVAEQLKCLTSLSVGNPVTSMTDCQSVRALCELPYLADLTLFCGLETNQHGGSNTLSSLTKLALPPHHYMRACGALASPQRCPALVQLRVAMLSNIVFGGPGPRSIAGSVTQVFSSLSGLTSVSIHEWQQGLGSTVSGTEVLTSLRDLAELSIHEVPRKTFRGLGTLSSCTGLQALQVGRMRDFEGLEALTQLTCLSFMCYTLPSESELAAKIAPMSLLQELHCNLWPVHTADLKVRLDLFLPVLPHLTCLTLQGNVRTLQTLRHAAKLPSLRALGLRTCEKRVWQAFKFLKGSSRLCGLDALQVSACYKQAIHTGTSGLLTPSRPVFIEPCPPGPCDKGECEVVKPW